MAYRYTRIDLGCAYDSTLQWPIFGPLKIFFDQVKDLQTFETLVRITTSASETQIAYTPVVTPYFIALVSDYPVLVRLASSGTQFTLKSNNVAATNIGSPLPDQCAFIMTGTFSYLSLAPIAGAGQTANVKVLITGDPQNAYT